MELIALIFGMFGVGFWLGVAVQRIAFKNQSKETLNQQNIKERK